MMKINTNLFSLLNSKQQGKALGSETANNRRAGGLNASFPATESTGSSNSGNKMRSQLKIYMLEIKDLQQQLSKLQDQETNLKEMQKQLLKIQGESGAYAQGEGPAASPASNYEKISRKLPPLQEEQEKLKEQIAEKLVARENITANLAVIREKQLAENIMKNVKSFLAIHDEFSMLSQVQLQGDNIQNLLK